MRAIDTNLLVRLIARDDDVLLKSAQAFVENGVWVSALVLAEAMWVLGSVYRRTSAEIADIIDGLLKHQNVALQDADAVAAALDLFRAMPSRGFVDFLILEIARKAGHLPLGTFDRALGKLDGAAIIS
jgi:predicted nucleic-acid-binding protein